MGVRDDATLGEHSRPAAMDDSHRVTGNTDRLVHSEGGGEVLIWGNVRELRLWGNKGGATFMYWFKVDLQSGIC